MIPHAADFFDPELAHVPAVVRRGELVYWKSTRLGHFAGSCEPIVLVSLVDVGTGQAFARFAENNSTQEHLKMLRCYIDQWGRPKEIRTGRASPFVGVGRTDKSARSPTSKESNQIQRALHELEIGWGLEDPREPDPWLVRFLREAKLSLAPCLRQSRVSTASEANRLLELIYLPRWNAGKSGLCAADFHAASPPQRKLNSILSVVTLREIDSQNMIRYRGQDYEVSGRSGLTRKGSLVRIEERLDNTIHFRLHNQKIKVRVVDKDKILRAHANHQKPKKDRQRGGHNRNWMKEFSTWVTPPLWTHLRTP